MTQTQYPEWQKAIREAQAARAEIRRQDDLQAEEKKRLERLEEGKQLREALAHLGIEAPELTENDYEVDGIRFFLLWQGDFQRWLYRNGNDNVRFELAVSHARPDDYEDDESWNFVCERVWVNAFVGRKDEWTELQARLADAIDSTTRRHKEELARWVQRMGRQMMPKPAPEPTLDEQLIALLRRIVRDEIGKAQDDV